MNLPTFPWIVEMLQFTSARTLGLGACILRGTRAAPHFGSRPRKLARKWRKIGEVFSLFLIKFTSIVPNCCIFSILPRRSAFICHESVSLKYCQEICNS